MDLVDLEVEVVEEVIRVEVVEVADEVNGVKIYEVVIDIS